MGPSVNPAISTTNDCNVIGTSDHGTGTRTCAAKAVNAAKPVTDSAKLTIG